MKMTNMDLSAEILKINKIIQPLMGNEAWGVKLGVGSFITMEFGAPVTKSAKYVHGEWHLWIYCCGWYLENPNHIFIGSEDPRDILKSEVTVLEGLRLENILISPIAFETNFLFSNGKVLHTFPLNFIDPCEYWKLFTPNGKVLILGPAKHWSYEDASVRNL
jgi:hypothetical protein